MFPHVIIYTIIMFILFNDTFHIINQCVNRKKNIILTYNVTHTEFHEILSLILIK